jgi:uncharacterized protein (TIRG00374 family)
MIFRRGNVFTAVLNELGNITLWPVAAFFVLMLLNTMLSSWKWQILLKADNINVPYRTLLSSYMSATFFNMFLPSSIGGDVYRIAHIGRYSDRRTHSAASVFADRLSGFFIVIVYGLIAALVGFKLHPELKQHPWIADNPEALWLLPLAFASMLCLVWALFQQKLLRWSLGLVRLDRIGIVRTILDQFLASFSAYRNRTRTICYIVLISMLFQFAMIVCVWLLNMALSIHIPPLYFAMFVPILILIEALPISVGGVGPREAAYEVLFMIAGATQAESLAMGVLYSGLSAMYCLSGGVVYLINRKRHSTDVSHPLPG